MKSDRVRSVARWRRTREPLTRGDKFDALSEAGLQRSGRCMGRKEGGGGAKSVDRSINVRKKTKKGDLGHDAVS